MTKLKKCRLPTSGVVVALLCASCSTETGWLVEVTYDNIAPEKVRTLHFVFRHRGEELLQKSFALTKVESRPSLLVRVGAETPTEVELQVQAEDESSVIGVSAPTALEVRAGEVTTVTVVVEAGGDRGCEPDVLSCQVMAWRRN